MDVVTSPQNEQVKYAAALHDKAARDADGCFLVEGAKLCADALDCGLAVTHVFAERGRKMDGLARRAGDGGARIIYCDARVMARLDSTRTPQGIVMVARKPERACGLRTDKPYVALENVQNPGNMGSVLRCAEAFGFAGALLAGACADPFSPKALRGSMGAALRLPIYIYGRPGYMASSARNAGLRLVCATLRPDARPVTEVNLSGGVCLVIGNEGAGVSDELAALCGESVIIPMAGGMQSLGAAAAAAVLLWEVHRRVGVGN